MFIKDGKKTLWASERIQLPNGEWCITIILATKNASLTHKIHKNVIEIVKAMIANQSKESDEH